MRSIIASRFSRRRALPTDGDKDRHARVQHIAFEYETLDDLLGTYVRLKKLGIPLLWAADQFIQTAIYYEDPDGNIIELNVNNFTNDWTVTEQLKTLPSRMHVNVDPEKMIAARKAGASAWELHERAAGRRVHSSRCVRVAYNPLVIDSSERHP